MFQPSNRSENQHISPPQHSSSLFLEGWIGLPLVVLQFHPFSPSSTENIKQLIQAKLLDVKLRDKSCRFILLKLFPKFEQTLPLLRSVGNSFQIILIY